MEEHELQLLPSTTPVSAITPTMPQADIPAKFPDQRVEGVPLLRTPSALRRDSTSSNSTYSERRGVWNSTKRIWWNTWTPEFLCGALVGFSLIAICALLWETNGKPRPKWAFGISVNVLLSLFVVCLKAGIYLPVSEGISELKWQSMRSGPRRLYEMEQYDSASRGAWGSLRFLFYLDTVGFDHSRIKWRSPATWKNILPLLKPRRLNFTRYLAKIAALITVLTFVADPFAQQLIQHVDCLRKNYDLPAELRRTNFHHRTITHFRDPRLVPELELAITIGTTFPPENPHSLVDFRCPSGNCTFPAFQTLGMCNSCADISDEIRTQGLRNQHDNSTYKEFALFDSRPGWNNSFLIAHETTMTVNGTPQVTSLNTSARVDNLEGFFEMFILKSADSPAAFKCKIFPCIREYNPSVRSAILTEELLSTRPIPWRNGVRGEFNTSTTRTLRRGEWEECTIDPSTGSVPDDCKWHLSFMHVISESLKKALNLQPILWTGSSETPYFGGPIASRLWNNGSVSIPSLDQYLDKLTDVLTSTIRNTGTKNMTSLEYPKPLRGTAYSLNTCINVRSEWLTVFIVLTGVTVTFWITFVFYHRSSSRRPKWKSSSLAVLFCDLDEEIKETIRGFQTRDEMFERSKRMIVRLRPDDYGRPKFKHQ